MTIGFRSQIKVAPSSHHTAPSDWPGPCRGQAAFYSNEIIPLIISWPLTPRGQMGRPCCKYKKRAKGQCNTEGNTEGIQWWIAWIRMGQGHGECSPPRHGIAIDWSERIGREARSQMFCLTKKSMLVAITTHNFITHKPHNKTWPLIVSLYDCRLT